MRRARGDILVVLDDDAVFEDCYCVRRIIDTFSARPEIGAVALRIVTHEDGHEVPMVPFSRLRLRQDDTLISTRRLVSYYVGAGHALRKKVLATTGVYQNSFVFGAEELDLSFKLVKCEMGILYCPDIVLHHYPGSPVLNRRGNPERYYALRNKVWIAYMHLPFPYFMVYPVVWVLYHALAALGAGRPAVAVSALRDAIAGLKHLKRRPLEARAVSYLRQNCGRLWY